MGAEAAFTTLLDIPAGFTDVQTEAAVLRHVLQDPVQGWRFSARLPCRGRAPIAPPHAVSPSCGRRGV